MMEEVWWERFSRCLQRLGLLGYCQRLCADRREQSEKQGQARRTIDLHLAVCNNLADLSLLLKILQALACQRTVDLHSVDEGGDRDETVGLDILVELVGGSLVEDDGVLCLVLDCCEGVSGLFRGRSSNSASSSAVAFRGTGDVATSRSLQCPAHHTTTLSVATEDSKME